MLPVHRRLSASSCVVDPRVDAHLKQPTSRVLFMSVTQNRRQYSAPALGNATNATYGVRLSPELLEERGVCCVGG